MARVASTGLEDQSISAFVLPEGGVAVSVAQKRTGLYSLYCGNNMGASIVLPSPLSAGYMRFGYYPTVITAAASVAMFFDSVGINNIFLSVSEISLMPILRRSGGAILSTGTIPLVLNAWNCIEIYFKIDDAPNGRFTLKVNGVTSIDFTGDTNYATNADTQTIHFGHKGGIVSGCQGYYDDIAINDTAGGVNDSWIGQGGIRLGFVDGAGANTGLTPSAGANWQCVDEIPASDADFVSSDTPDDYDLYTLDTSSMPAAGTVSAVKVIFRAKVEVDAGSMAPVIRSEGTTEEQTIQALNTSFVTYGQIFDVDPIDDAAWTIAKVNAMEIGVQVE